MEKCKMKKVVVLKNLPSNLIEEAFVVVKSRKVAKSLECIDGKNKKFENDCKDDGYIVREAESVLASFVSLVEKKESKKIDVPLKKRYNVLKFYSILVTIVFVASIVF